ncbi:ZIP family metal transporter [Candidatus Woesearchaeota archaeon]|nr:ZIP family metal transporter [Candidatus Woesearchaeota archaeon]
MPSIWAYSIISVLLVSFISLIGALTLLFKKINLKNILLFLVSFAAGALLGDSFIHLLPEAVEESGFTLELSIYLLLGILIFFILEKFIHWRHCHLPTTNEHPHPLAFMNLIGDGLHNFFDGMIIAGSYIASIPLGIATTIAVILHEIPQEIGDFGILLHGGFTKKKALAFNFLSAILALIGAVLVLIIGNSVEKFSIFLVPFTAGGFIYIAGSDLIPELHKETKPIISFMQLIALILGILVMVALIFLE